MEHIKERGVILVDDDHHLFACLLVGAMHQTIQTHARRGVFLVTSVFLLHQLQLYAKDFLHLFCCQMLGSAQVEMQHGVLLPVPLQLFGLQPAEQLPLAGEERVEC